MPRKKPKPNPKKTRDEGKATKKDPRAKAARSAGKGASARPRQKVPVAASDAKPYQHPTADLATRPEAGTQAQFRRKKAPKTYRYDSSIAPELRWDGENGAREQGEALIRRILDANSLDEAKAAAEQLATLSRPFLNWAGKAERLSFDVPTLPLFVHERLSTKAILETLKRHMRDQQETLDLFGDPRHSVTDQVLRAYEHRDRWVNRMVLGDSLVVMNSLLEYEGLGGQVQMIYIDPPYGVEFGSNFQPFVRKRSVEHNNDVDLTREPEMVQAYRDTWELGLHSYLTYLRDRLLLARDLLMDSGSVFVQISDENLHYVREVADEIFGTRNFVSVISFVKTSALNSPDAKLSKLATNNDFLIWYARDLSRMKFRQVYRTKVNANGDVGTFNWIQLPDGERRRLSKEERAGDSPIPEGRLFASADLTSQKPTTVFDLTFDRKSYNPLPRGWRTTQAGMTRLIESRRIFAAKNSLRFVQYLDDFAVTPFGAFWEDTGTGSFTEEKLYAVQTGVKVLQRCLAMTTDPGDLVLDPTCGSGTTAYVAEQWGRRWITIDTSRVPLALARQRLLTATFPWFELKDDARGPAAGFVYKRRQNSRGEEVGGIVPHVTLKSIANDEPPAEEVLVDRPEQVNGITRVTGPFVFEATIPTPVDLDGDGTEDSGAMSAEEYGSFVERMIETLRRSPVVQLGGGKTVTLRNVRPPAKALSLSAEALIGENGDARPAAVVFGPEHGAVSEKLVSQALREANGRNYAHLFVVGFAIEARARELIEHADDVYGVTATYLAVTPDVGMGDLLKTMRSSQIFSVAGLPEMEVIRAARRDKSDPDRYKVRLLGLDTFDPVTMETDALGVKDIPAWLLDTDYNDLCFHVRQAFFPGTGAWENLKRSLRAEFEESVWAHLEGDESAEFEAQPDTKIAVKVIDRRGNELTVVKTVAEALRS